MTKGHRIEIVPSSQHVEVVVDGVKVAESHEPTVLYETGCPPRYYLPLSDIRTELLEPSQKQTHCPFKGDASYWTLNIDGRTHADLLWTYPTPIPESGKIAGLVSFYNDKVDLYVDGKRWT